MIKPLFMAAMLAATLCTRADGPVTYTENISSTIVININQGQATETNSALAAQQTTEQEKPKEQGRSKTFFATIIVGTLGVATRVGWEVVKTVIDNSWGGFP